MKYILALFWLVVMQCAHAATVDTVEVYSISMHKKIKTVVIKPASYATDTTVPVVYLLHGFGDNHATWVTNVPAIKAAADAFHFMIVCPDASRSWYFDSPGDQLWKYET